MMPSFMASHPSRHGKARRWGIRFNQSGRGVLNTCARHERYLACDLESFEPEHHCPE